ncbi:MAG: hypothetical protein LBM26_02195, partial [Methanobrevibacter sp.]|nr:hypothetical protein [Methanobrevibacter sp.]
MVNKKVIVIIIIITMAGVMFLLNFASENKNNEITNNTDNKSSDNNLNNSNITNFSKNYPKSTSNEFSNKKSSKGKISVKNKEILKNKKTNETMLEINPLTKNEAIKLAKNNIYLGHDLIFGNNAYEWPGGAWQIYVYNKTTGEIVDFYIIGQYGTI